MRRHTLDACIERAQHAHTTQRCAHSPGQSLWSLPVFASCADRGVGMLDICTEYMVSTQNLPKNVRMTPSRRLSVLVFREPFLQGKTISKHKFLPKHSSAPLAYLFHDHSMLLCRESWHVCFPAKVGAKKTRFSSRYTQVCKSQTWDSTSPEGLAQSKKTRGWSQAPGLPMKVSPANSCFGAKSKHTDHQNLRSHG